MVMVKATPDYEAGAHAGPEAAGRHGQVQRGAGQGRRDARRRRACTELEGRARALLGQQADGHRRAVRETKELVAGFWLWKVKSKEEAIEWVKRCPTVRDGLEIEIRQVFEADDFGEEFTPELREQEQRLRKAVEKK
jgi:hypothetical protein